MIPRLNWKVVRAVWERDLRAYFLNPTGYVFITVFIFLSAVAAFWQESFFANNLANLDELNSYFPYLLVFFIPALTMSVWADERRSGTDELLLTLPATDVEITLGKYLATVGIFSVALFLSLSHILVLSWLGAPDWGLMFSNYVGYLFVGAALLAVGMFASLLTRNATVGFVLGALFCAILVFIDSPQFNLSYRLQKALAPAGVLTHFKDFADGVISVSAIFYFLSIIGVALYLNVIVLGRRHWSSGQKVSNMKVNYIARAVAVAVAVVSANAMLGRTGLRADTTAEGLHSLSDATETLIDTIDPSRPVFVLAYISEETPQSLVETRANLLAFLREIDALAGNKIEVVIRNPEPYSDDARDARDKFGITPRALTPEGESRAGARPVFLGVAFTCGSREEVIPFFERGLPVEYELVRSIRMVTQVQRKKIGVLVTDAKIFGGFDFQTMQNDQPWSIVRELEKQYEVTQVTPANILTEEVDGLIVPLASSLPQADMDILLRYIQAGHPTLLLDDPLPTFNVKLSAVEQRGADQNPLNRQNAPQPEAKGDIRTFMAQLGVEWNPADIIWQSYNPHPDYSQLPSEIAFLAAENPEKNPFNEENPITSGLQEMALIYSGHLMPAPGATTTFTPLLTIAPSSGIHNWYQLVQRSFFGVNINRHPKRVPGGMALTVAAHISSAVPKGDSATADSAKSPAINVVFVPDLDFVSEQFFQIRNMGMQNLTFDNISFFLNSADYLMGDSSFITLRKKRIHHRTLETVEEQTRGFLNQRITDEQHAETEAAKQLEDAQKRLNEKVQAINARTDLDIQTKQIMAQNVQEVENRRFETTKETIEAERDATIDRSREDMEREIVAIEARIKTLAVTLPPIPALIFGAMVFVRRRSRENEGATAARMLRN